MNAVVGRRTIIAICLAIAAPAAAGAAGSAGAAAATMRVSVLQRAVARGEILSPTDFATEDRAGIEKRDLLSARAAAGMEAARDLRSGDVVRTNEVMAPRLVRRGEPVTIIVRAPGLSISTDGRALSNGGAGDMVRVFSTSTNRTLDGLVDGVGLVRIVAR